MPIHYSNAAWNSTPPTQICPFVLRPTEYTRRKKPVMMVMTTTKKATNPAQRLVFAIRNS